MLKNGLQIIKKIEDNGYSAYIVGGCTRDYYMKKESYDVDICTNAKPKELIKIFDNATLPKEKYGAVTLYDKGVRYEITTFRKELKYENRRPIEIEYTNNLKEDIERRDFTINTLCMNSSLEIIDLFNGKRDIDKRIIRSLGNASVKFNEDPLRILRAIRFATVLNFKLDKDVILAIKDKGNLVREISYERKKSELSKIFVSKNVKYGIKLFVNYGEGGIAQDWNFGISQCKTEYITIAHQDDIYEPEYLVNILKNIEKARKPIILFTDYGEIKKSKKYEALDYGTGR